MAKRQPRTNEQLQQASWHVHYEAIMLENMFELLRDPSLPDNHRRWALIESFLVHARNLRNFFVESSKRDWHPDDIAVDDFFEGQPWHKRLGPVPASLVEDRIERINREVAHLSYDRLIHDRPTKWPLDVIFADIKVFVDAFKAEAPPERLCDDWRGGFFDPVRLLPGVVASTSSQPTVSVTMVNTPTAYKVPPFNSR